MVKNCKCVVAQGGLSEVFPVLSCYIKISIDVTYEDFDSHMEISKIFIILSLINPNMIELNNPQARVLNWMS